MPRHGDWQLEAAGIGGVYDGVGVSTEAAPHTAVVVRPTTKFRRWPNVDVKE